jgi:hypothetical protein
VESSRAKEESQDALGLLIELSDNMQESHLALRQECHVVDQLSAICHSEEQSKPVLSKVEGKNLVPLANKGNLLCEERGPSLRVT